MITPLEIETKEFSRSMRGYDRDEVDEFLDDIIIDLQELLKEMDALKEEVAVLRAENDEHQKSQKQVMETLDSAKRLMKDITDSAEKRADIIIQNAKMDAEVILSDARASAPPSSTSGEDLYDKISIFRSKYRQLLQDELESLDSRSDDILTSLEKEFIPATIDTQVLDFENLEDEPIKINERHVDDNTIVATNAASDANATTDTVVLDAKSIDDLIAQAEADLKE